ncbi:hypothetical protein LCGC14_0442010 [marine sediment metagenome]|uniref:Uncharacterized protein n=1 Tax=marine sediment metagenome TaxID=412755 RepID=A0A0F9T3F3_9ZZZZ
MSKKYLCKICGNFFNHVHGPELNYCSVCWRKTKTRIPDGPRLFNEEVSEKVQVNLSLTKSQKEVLVKRLDSLYPYRNPIHKLKGVSNYVRDLIFADLIKFEKDMEVEK